MVGSVQVMVQKDVYDALTALKARYRCKSYTELLRKFSHDFECRDMLAAEISEMFTCLKKQVVATVLNGRMSSLLEVMRVATVTVAKAHPSYRSEFIDEAKAMMEITMHEIVKVGKEHEAKMKEKEDSGSEPTEEDARKAIEGMRKALVKKFKKED